MKNQKLIKEVWLLLMVLIPVIYYLFVYNRLPAEIPIHWNYKGEIDRYGSPLILLLIGPAMYLLMMILPKLDPRRSALKDFPETYYKIRFASLLLLMAVSMFVLLYAQGYQIPPTRFVAAAAFGIMAFIGNYFGTLRSNWFIGIRNPWTLESDYVWRKTHLMAGRLWVPGGLLAMIGSFVLPEKILPFLLVLAVLVLGIIPTVYSYVIFRQNKQSKA
jgi:uncharacterized membrane protein